MALDIAEYIEKNNVPTMDGLSKNLKTLKSTCN